jgi:hypothetical protein
MKVEYFNFEHLIFLWFFLQFFPISKFILEKSGNFILENFLFHNTKLIKKLKIYVKQNEKMKKKEEAIFTIKVPLFCHRT